MTSRPLGNDTHRCVIEDMNFNMKVMAKGSAFQCGGVMRAWLENPKNKLRPGECMYVAQIIPTMYEGGPDYDHVVLGREHAADALEHRSANQVRLRILAAIPLDHELVQMYQAFLDMGNIESLARARMDVHDMYKAHEEMTLEDAIEAVKNRVSS